MFNITVLLKVIDPAHVAEIRDHLRQAAELSRTEPGCHQFEVLHEQTQEQIFILWERWESKAAWETHKQAEAFLTIYQPLVLPKVERIPYFCDRVE